MDALAVRLEELLEAVAREELSLAVAEPRPARVGALHQASHELFSLDRLSQVQRRLAAASGEEAKRARFLLAGLAAGRGTCAAAGELDQYVTWRANAHVPVGEGRSPIGGVGGVIAASRDVDARHAAETAWLEAVDAQEPVLEGAFSAYRRAVEELGYGDFTRSTGILTGVDLPGLAAEARRFIDETDPVYFELLDWHLPRYAGVERPSATAADALRLERADPLDPDFAGRGPARWVGELMGSSGFDITASGRLRLHGLGDDSRAAGPSVHLVRVPEEIVVLHGQRAGRAARAALLRGLGAGCHAAYTPAALPVELRRLGDASVPHAFGLLFESVIGTRAPIERFLRVPRAEVPRHLRLATLLDLLHARAAAARLEFELWWHGEPESRERGARYADALTGATGLKHDPRAALAECVPPFRSAQELRARQLGEVLIRYLTERCDEDWYRNPRAPRVLVELMSHGRSFTADELAIQLGAQRLSLDPLRNRAEQHAT